jgi:uncharacterized protein with PQ loop repeat
MAKTRKRVKIPDLLKFKQREPDEALALLRKHLKTAAGGSYHTVGTYFTEILDRNDKNAQVIGQIKDLQWRIVNYCVLLYVAIVGAVQLTKGTFTNLPNCIVAAVVSFVSMVLIYYVARRMMDKTVEDLAFYREHSRVNEEMLSITSGLQLLANEVVSSRRPDLRNKHEFSYSADQNSKVFTNWLGRIMVGAGIVALAVSQVLIWAK